MNGNQLRGGLHNGSAVREATEALRRIKNAYGIASAQLHRDRARAAQTASAALNAKRGGKRALAQKLAREAFHARVNAEVAAYAAAYLTPAQQDAAAALGQLKVASAMRGVNAAAVGQLTDKASLLLERAQGLFLAAFKTYQKASAIPEPPVVSNVAFEAAKERSGMRATTTVSATPIISVMNPSKVPALLANFYPEEMVAAAGTLQGLGDVPEDTNTWWMRVRDALAEGASNVASVAQESGVEVSKGNPVVQAGVQAAGDVLKRFLALARGGDSSGAPDAPKAPTADSASALPAIVSIGALAVGGYALWRWLK